MPHPMKVYVKNQGPGWLEPTHGKYVEQASDSNRETKKKDVAATMRNHGDNQSAKQVKNATFVGAQGRARGGRADGGKSPDVKPLPIEQSNIHKALKPSELAERMRPLPTRRSGEPNFGEPGYTGRKSGGRSK